MVWISAQKKLCSKMHSLRVYFSAQRNKLISSKQSGAGTEDVHKVNWPFYEPLMFLNDNLVSRSTKSNMTQNHLTSEKDTQESLYDTEDITPRKKASKKCDAFKNTQTNELIKEATNTLKNLNELKTQHSSSKTANDIFCEMIAVHLKNINERAAKEFLKLDIHRAIITAIHHNVDPIMQLCRCHGLVIHQALLEQILFQHLRPQLCRT